MNEILPFPKRRKLRVPTGWEIDKNNFYDLEPEEELLVEGNANNNGWSLFEEELLYCRYEKQNLILDMGWFPNYEHDGKFILSLIKDKNWRDQQIISQTQSLAEITQAINNTLLRVSLENGDFNIEDDGVMLQELRVDHGWKFINNEFFDLDLGSETKLGDLSNRNVWQLFHDNMLHLEWFNDIKKQIRVGWFPAHDPGGRFNIIATTAEYFEPPLVDFSTRDKTEVIEIVEHLMKEIHKAKPNRT